LKVAKKIEKREEKKDKKLVGRSIMSKFKFTSRNKSNSLSFGKGWG
jgi:hypothetical protein